MDGKVEKHEGIWSDETLVSGCEDGNGTIFQEPPKKGTWILEQYSSSPDTTTWDATRLRSRALDGGRTAGCVERRRRMLPTSGVAAK